MNSCYSGSQSGFSINHTHNFDASQSITQSLYISPRIFPYQLAEQSQEMEFPGAYSMSMTKEVGDLIFQGSFAKDSANIQTITPITETTTAFIGANCIPTNDVNFGLAGSGDFSTFDIKCSTLNNFRGFNAETSLTVSLSDSVTIGLSSSSIQSKPIPPVSALIFLRAPRAQAGILSMSEPSLTTMLGAKYMLGPISSLDMLAIYNHEQKAAFGTMGYTLAIGSSLVSGSVNSKKVVSSKFTRAITDFASISLSANLNHPENSYQFGISIDIKTQSDD